MDKIFRNYLYENGFLWGPEHHPYGVSGLMVYGPNGKRLKTNIENKIRSIFNEEGFDEIETPVFLPEKAWQASGHLGHFGTEMFRTQTSDGQVLYGRPEIATTIYPLLRSLSDFYRSKLPFKVFQIGLALPNDFQTEWQTRTRQYTAHEGHLFVEPKMNNVEGNITYLKNLAFKIMLRIGLPETKLVFREKISDEKPFYAQKAYGIYAQDGLSELEILGIQYRSSRDFETHNQSGKKMLKINGVYPEVFEISFSSDRPIYLLLKYSFINTPNRQYLHLPLNLAPIPVMICPQKDAVALISRSRQIEKDFKQSGVLAQVLTGGSISTKYKRADAFGTPFVLTIDDTSLDSNTYLLRERDSMLQRRGSLSGLLRHIKKLITNKP